MTAFSWRRLLPVADMGSMVNVPFSLSSLIFAIVGIAAIVAISGSQLAYATASVVAARMVFVSAISVAGPGALQQSGLLSMMFGKVAVLWPEQYLLGLGVYALLAIIWVLMIRGLRQLVCNRAT